eukprot:6167021-Amphidinium_carterae.1
MNKTAKDTKKNDCTCQGPCNRRRPGASLHLIDRIDVWDHANIRSILSTPAIQPNTPPPVSYTHLRAHETEADL